MKKLLQNIKFLRVIIVALALIIVIMLNQKTKIFVPKDVNWISTGELRAYGYLEATNYDVPEDLYTLYYIQYQEGIGEGQPSTVLVKEDTFREFTWVEGNIKFFDIVRQEANTLVATDGAVTIRIDGDDVRISDIYGKESILSQADIVVE